MKCTILAVLAFVAVASGSIAPLPLSVVHPGLVHPGLALASPWAHGLVNPLAVGVVQLQPVHAHAAPAPVATVQTIQTVQAAPAIHTVQAAPAIHTVQAVPAIHAVPAVASVSAIQPGYVAATRGSLHVAPLPGNTPYASHHLNTVPAPGTK